MIGVGARAPTPDPEVKRFRMATKSGAAQHQFPSLHDKITGRPLEEARLGLEHLNTWAEEVLKRFNSGSTVSLKRRFGQSTGV